MRKLSTVLAGLVLAVTLSSPAWADTVAHRHHDFNGQSDSPGQGDSRYDQRHHDNDDDGSILF